MVFGGYKRTLYLPNYFTLKSYEADFSKCWDLTKVGRNYMNIYYSLYFSYCLK